MDHTKKTVDILREISRLLNVFIAEEDDPGLFTGYGGCALFYAYYYRFTGKKRYLDKVFFLIVKMTRALEEKELTYSHCSGIAGLTWCIQHLIKHEFVELEEANDLFDEVDPFLYEAMKYDLEQGQYDFLHLGLGVTPYFIDKLPDQASAYYLEEVVTKLQQVAVTVRNGITWSDKLAGEIEVLDEPNVYNLGLSHGVPAIVSILSLLYEHNIMVSTTAPLIENSVNWLLSVKNEPSPGSSSLYPKKVTHGKSATRYSESRLGWCYGDLGIGLTLWNCGTRLYNDLYKKEALSIFEYTALHRSEENGNINDACLCHGSMGVSHIYRKIYNATGEKLFLKASDYWLYSTLHFSHKKDGPAGFKYRTAKGFKNDYSLLEGITGVGLGLMASLDKNTVPAWDRCLLIS